MFQFTFSKNTLDIIGMVISLFDVYLPCASLCFYKNCDKYHQLLALER